MLGWFKEWIGYPSRAAGSLVSGGSAGNMTAHRVRARDRSQARCGTTSSLYVSDQAHSSVARAARILGFRPGQVRVLPADAAFRLDPATLRGAMDADVAAGRTPFLVAANAGATNSGAVDPMPQLAEVCHQRGAWLHVDGAYGGFAALADRVSCCPGSSSRTRSRSTRTSGSTSPSSAAACSCERDEPCGPPSRSLPDYLRDAEAADEEVNFSDLGIQLTRSARALKLWLSLRFFGLDAFRIAIRRSLDLAALAASRIEDSETLELMAPPSLGVVCFRRRDLDEVENASLAAALERSDVGLISTTRLHGRLALRLCILNHTSGPEDVGQVLDFLEETRPEVGAKAADAVRRYERHPTIVSSWPGLPEADLPSLRTLPLFADLQPDQAALVGKQASLREATSGEMVVEQWSLGRDFYVILEGTAAVSIDGEHARDLGPGEFFGELTALDWGAGFAYPRLASVRATSALRLLVFPDGRLGELVRRYPSIDREIRAAVAERLPRHA